MEDPPKHPAVAALFAELLAATGLNAAGLAKKLEITPQAISNYVVGRNEPGRKMMAGIIKAFPAINAVWLATGEGEPFPNGVHNEKAEQPYKEHLRKAAALSAEMAKPTAPPPTEIKTATTAAASHLEEPAPAKFAMAVNLNVEEMSDAERADFYKLYYERTKQKLTAAEQTITQLTEAQEHAEVVQLVARAGGRSGFNDASADAADPTDEPPLMVAETNHEYAERAAEAQRNSIGFVYGQGR